MTDLVQLAKLGNPQAIAALFNRQLNSKGVVVKATLQRDCLEILLESPKALKKEAIVAGMRKRLVQLNPAGIKRVRLQALKQGTISPAWSYEFSLDSASAKTESVSLIDAAKQGNVEAIAALLEQTLAPQNINAGVRLERGCLTVTLEAPRVPDRATVEPIVRHKLNQIKSPTFATVNLEGKQLGASSCTWSQPLNLSVSPQKKTKSDVRGKVSDILLLAFSIFVFFIFCRLLKFNFFAGLLLALIPATIAYNRGRSFLAWYAYGLNLYLPATLHSSFLGGFNPYGIIFLFLGTTFTNNFLDSMGLLLLVPNLIFGLIPAIIAASSKKKDFVNWYIYGIVFFLVAFFHAILLKAGVLKTLKHKNLEEISLLGQDLTGANFQGANLQGADLRKTKLLGVNFKNANLQNADLSEANLWATNFERANLAETDLSRVTNRWQGNSKWRLETFLPWWVIVGFGLSLAQLLLWVFFFGSPLGLLLSGKPEISWNFLLMRAPLTLSIFTFGSAAILTLLTIVLGRKYFNLAIAPLGLIGIASIGSTFWSLLSSSSAGISPEIVLISAISMAILAVSILQAIQSLKKNQWNVYCTWLGMAIAMSFWSIALVMGKLAVDRYLDALVPQWLAWNPILSGIWFVATLAAWGAIAGNIIGILALERMTRFRGGNMTGANFTDAELTNADFTNADMTEVNWTGVKLKDAIAPDGRVFKRGLR